MGKVEMDLSEYQEIQEHKRALQDALNKQEEMQKEIEKLNKEKIEALENAQYKVIHKTKRHIHKHVASKVPVETAFPMLKSFVENPTRFIGDGDTVQFHRLASTHDGSWKGLAYEGLMRSLFTTVESSSLEETVSDKYTGFDEVKTELRKEIEDQLGKEYKELKEQAKKFNKQEKELSSLAQALAIRDTTITDLNEKLEKEIESRKEIENRFSKFLLDINALAKEGWNYIFGKAFKYEKDRKAISVFKEIVTRTEWKGEKKESN